MSSDYTTTAAVKSQLGITGSGDDALLDLYVSQASAAIRNICGRNFHETTGTLYYRFGEPDTFGSRLLFDADVQSVVSISNGTNGTLADSDYITLPPNVSPKYGVELRESSGKTWTYGLQGDRPNAIVVTAVTGYCTTADRPADITLAATKLAAWLYQNRDNVEQAIQTADGTTVLPTEAPPMVMRLLRRYIKLRGQA